MPDPRFCSSCGKKLKAAEKSLPAGFDPFTGKPKATSIPMLVCPERGDAPSSDHDRYEKNPDNTKPDEWERWDG